MLSIDVAVFAPVVRNQPEDCWVEARNSGAIPPEIYGLYQRAGFLSFGSGSRFLGDDENILFSYFSMTLNCLMEMLTDAKEQLAEFVKDHNLTYDLGKKARGEPWEPAASTRAQRHLRDLLIALHASLDTVADLIALFLTGRIPRLRVGRAQFFQIENWLAQPLNLSAMVATPYDSHLADLYGALKPLVLPGPPEQDWLPLMRMLRNKGAHLGQRIFRQVGLHDTDLRFHVFLPREWPYIWEKHMKPHDPNVKADPTLMPKLLQETLINQDILTFTRCLHGKVKEIVSVCARVANTMYAAFENFAVNQTALAELERSSEAYEFEYFIER
ncbi:MAG: hypothetical protein DMG35_01605 [Acidobacteria bacterium]|nr:MAG: hypothetical protein DMG35_01605 [Acidobacteriota bacterium]